MPCYIPLSAPRTFALRKWRLAWVLGGSEVSAPIRLLPALVLAAALLAAVAALQALPVQAKAATQASLVSNTAVSAPRYQQQVVSNICGRTQEVQDAIINTLDSDYGVSATCDTVTEADLVVSQCWKGRGRNDGV